METSEMAVPKIKLSKIETPNVKARLILSFKPYTFCWFKIGLCGVILFLSQQPRVHYATNANYPIAVFPSV